MRKVFPLLFVMLTSVSAQSVPAPHAPIFTHHGSPFHFVTVLARGITTGSFQVPPISNPSGLSFSSSDYSTVAGTPPVAVVSNYTVDILSGTTVVKSQNIGKPTLSGGVVTYNALASLRGALPDGSYMARVWAEGPGGRTVSANSDPFLWATPVVLPPAPQSPQKPVIIR